MNDDALREETLKNRFLTLWGECSQSNADIYSLPVWHKLKRRYSETGRYYHTLNHLFHCLEQMNLAYACIDDPKALEIAILFHDAICEPNAKDNEQRSADLFERTANNRFNSHFINRVKKLILSTTHKTKPPSRDEKLICDIDLSSFALPWKHFLRDSDAIRAEHASTPDQLYYTAKLKFMNTMLDRPVIFFTEFFYERCEQQARMNIQKYMSHLEHIVPDKQSALSV